MTDTAPSSSTSKAESAIKSLSTIISTAIPPTKNPALSLLQDPNITSEISNLLRRPDSGSGDNNLCRWLYDTFQSADPALQLVVLRFIPIVAGLYLSRVPQRKPQAGFEAVLLALYAHETVSRAGQPVTVNVPDLSHPSIYHESKSPTKNTSTNLNLAVISPSLEPYGTVRSTKRARIVGVALEKYFNKISQMPNGSKIEFCEFVETWAGEDGEIYKDDGNSESVKRKERVETEGRILLPWELLQPILRILGHCMLGSTKKNYSKEVFEAASAACRSVYARSLHDINPNAILATGSLLKLGKMAMDSDSQETDYTEIRMTDVISI